MYLLIPAIDTYIWHISPHLTMVYWELKNRTARERKQPLQVNGRGKQLHTTVSVGGNHLSLPLT